MILKIMKCRNPAPIKFFISAVNLKFELKVFGILN